MKYGIDRHDSCSYCEMTDEENAELHSMGFESKSGDLLDIKQKADERFNMNGRLSEFKTHVREHAYINVNEPIRKSQASLGDFV